MHACVHAYVCMRVCACVCMCRHACACIGIHVCMRRHACVHSVCGWVGGGWGGAKGKEKYIWYIILFLHMNI